ncbi:MAG: ATP-binding protein [Prevotella sp.]|jgi:predicted AAA+ superfamily ATPase|nr:ATP-binding protein [Prevotella sp.]MCH3970764.1 ATP-binding protein [Prevotella sp.]MCH3991423.1 ATP-binding protein [Prevotella sp.]MCH4018603.1 ATP-binding protein [Prevotella sp.]MCI1349571.1 ATP-binding protein [Prevotella sp.]MCI1474834.1 ATP-binding protein [Prevotella sp.]
MIINRAFYLNKLIERRNNGRIKIITGIRRCGKSVLLFELFRNYLKNEGVDDYQIIALKLDSAKNARYRNPLELDKYVREQIKDANKQYYILLDEIQEVKAIPNPWLDDKDSTIGFVDTLLGLMDISNVDIYVTGSNSRMLSSDIITEFKDRGDEIYVNPFTFKEFHEAYTGDKNKVWHEYITYGGLPRIISEKTHEDKSKYLRELIRKTYLTDVIERNNIQNDISTLDDLLNIIASNIGSLTNPSKLENAFASVKHKKITDVTISSYLSAFEDAFIIRKANQYDVKGKKYINTPLKYYFTDIGLRNAQLNFRQQEETHIMENVIFNELYARGFNVDVGVVEYNYKNKEGKSKRTWLEVDFVANKGNTRCYIQSAFSIPDENKRLQETNSLRRINDSYRKIVVVRDAIIPWYDENGIYYIGVEEFVLNYIDEL